MHLLLFTFAASIAGVVSGCRVFSPTNTNGYYSRPDGKQTQRVAKGLECNSTSPTFAMSPCSNSECLFFGQGTFNANGTNNVSLSNEDAAPLYGFITNHSNIPFYQYASAQNVSEPYCVSEGLVGILDFFPWLLCITGKVSECAAGTVENGTTLEICAPTYNTMGLVNGTLMFTRTGGDEPPEAYSNNPALTATPLTTTTGTPTAVNTASVTPSFTNDSGGLRSSVKMMIVVLSAVLGLVVWS